MKPIRHITLTAILISIALAGAAIGEPAPAEPTADPAAALQRIKVIAGQLTLDAGQRERLDKIFKQGADDITNAAPDLQNASPEDKAAKYREIMSDVRTQIAGVLTDDQKQDLQSKLQSARSSTPTPNSTAGNIPATAPATQSSPRAAGTPQRGGRGQQMIERLRDALSQLDLTDEQKTKTAAVLDDLGTQIKQLRQSLRGGGGNKQDLRDKIAAIFTDTKSKLGEILTPAQGQKLRSILQQQNAGQTPPVRLNPPTSAPGATPTSAPAPTGNVKADTPSAPAPIAATAVPDIGQPAPPFQLKRINGQSVSLADSKHHFLVLIFASLTAPAFRDHAADVNALHDKFGSRGVDFLLIYTKEQHPTGGWELQRNKDDGIDVPLAKSDTDRMAAARQLHDSLHLSVPVAIDSIDDSVSTAYGVNQTVPAFMIDRNGAIAFHQSWLEADTLSHAIEETVKASK